MWIEVTENYTNEKVLINKYQIKCVYRESVDVEFWTIGLDRYSFSIVESYDEVKKLLEGEQNAKCE